MRDRIIITIIILLSINFSSTMIQTGEGNTNFTSVPENTNYLFNFSVSNEATTTQENITRFQLIIPTELTVVIGSGNSSKGTSWTSYTSQTMNWNQDGLIMNGTTEYFWFNATTASGEQTKQISTSTNNLTGMVEEQVITITIIDITPPNVTVLSPEDFTTYDEEYLIINVSISEPGDCEYSKNNGATNRSMESNDEDTIFWKNESFYGEEKVIFYCKDDAGNENNTIYVEFDVEIDEEETTTTTTTTATNNTNQTNQNNQTNITTTNSTSKLNTTNTKEESNTINKQNFVSEEKESSWTRWIITMVPALIGFIVLVYVIKKLFFNKEKSIEPQTIINKQHPPEGPETTI